MEEQTPFIFRTPFLTDQRDAAIEQNVASIERDLGFIRANGYDEFARRRDRGASDENGGDAGGDDQTSVAEARNLGSTFDGSLRDYQIYMLEHAGGANTIVHLGTGMGKTLISIFLIKEFISRRGKRNENDVIPDNIVPDNGSKGAKTHIMFLVPSIALAVQHTDTLQANLPCVVATACHTSSHSSKAREEIADADVIVATHGTALDLLRHYPEVLSMSSVELLVMDECHYATGRHNYATILKDFYHPLPRGARPRVLGLTASPLINVGVNATESRLRTLISDFEKIMDARLLGLPADAGPGRKEAEESIVTYDSRLDGFDGILPARPGLLHRSRTKEIDQLQHLCDEVGLRVTAVYASTLAREIGRNEFERETPEQFENLKSHLAAVARWLSRRIHEGRAGDFGGHTHKMSKLENLLKRVVKPGDDSSELQAPVGIVFVERRITAIALCNYFCHERKCKEGARPNHLGILTCQANNTNGRSAGRNPGQERDSGCGLKYPTSNESRCPIRCDLVVRQATQVFKYLARQAKLDQCHRDTLEEDWVHQVQSIRTVIKKLRCRETNVLMATSVVEEGVDVEACRFIISFDGLKTIKSYIQMKGRARQKNAQFFVFVDDSAESKSQPLSLGDAQAIENTIHTFIAKNERDTNIANHLPACSGQGEVSSSDEEEIMHKGKYATSLSYVDLSSSKSLLNRYAMSVPLDPNCRTSKAAAVLHMPIYAENRLVLPSHLPPDTREVVLPVILRGENKKKKQAILALAACVRLHKLGLLSERLLPLEISDMKEWLLEKARVELPSWNTHQRTPFKAPFAACVYVIGQKGSQFKEEIRRLQDQESKEVQLALISLLVLPENLPVHYFNHKELGSIECRMTLSRIVALSALEWKKLTEFHCILFNSRWRQRRKKSKWFSFDERILGNRDDAVAPYAIGCCNIFGSIEWKVIEKTITEFSRTLTEREEAACGTSTSSPRICSPSYNPGVSYIVYGPSGKCCRDEFPNDDFESFQEYYAKKYALKTNPSGKMMLARRLWELPQSLASTQAEPSPDESHKEITTVELPQELCVEGPLADPVIMLHSVMLPQLLYKVERYLKVKSFLEHCSHNFPIIGKCLSELTVEAVMEALTAKSCSLDYNYDRLEWLGDAVLKLLHTDALLQWEYTSYLHEGYLSMLRSVMGSNDRLKDICQAAGLDRFILLNPLNRATWRPFGLQYHDQNDSCSELSNSTYDVQDSPMPSTKVCADVIEALLGLVYLSFGYEQCNDIACEMGLSFRRRDSSDACRKWSDISPGSDLVSFACGFLGVKTFSHPHLLVEATTHHTCLHKPTPSYQRLEWIGDAVLCLAAREWLFEKEEKLSVPKLVVLETTLVCNESLAYIGYGKGLHHFIDHRNSAFPGRFQSYQLDLELGRGLWSTDPPKVIPDVIEALIGAVHVDQGHFKAQKAALCVISPLCQSLSRLLTNDSDDLAGLLHPKQNLFEITGGIVSVRVYKKDLFLQRESLSSLWNFQSRGGSGEYVGVVRCKRIILAAVEEASRDRAKNVACELAVQILKCNPEIISQLQILRSSLAEQHS